MPVLLIIYFCARGIIFENALSGPLKSIVKLNDEEIQFLVSYFENSNGQVPYGQFCEIIHNDLPKTNEGLSTRQFMHNYYYIYIYNYY